MKKKPPLPESQSWLCRDQLALVTFEDNELTVYTHSGLKIGFLGEISDREFFAESLMRTKAKWIRIPVALRAFPMGISS